jgi:hypothetical protein
VITETIHGLQLVSEANAHTHWRQRQKRAKAQRLLASRVLGPRVAAVKPQLPLAVTITRIAPRPLDSDNAVGSAKHVRDGVADALGINDGDPRVTWVVRQERGAPKTYAVRVEVTERDSAQKSCGELDTAHASEQSTNTSAGARVRAKR